MDLSLVIKRIFILLGLSLFLSSGWFLAFHSILPLIPQTQEVEIGEKSVKLLKQGKIEAINLTRFLELKSQSGVLILDSRASEAFLKGHIPGAMNLPYEQFEQYLPILEQQRGVHTVISYCDGSDCMSSIELAQKVSFLFENVYYFFGGWAEWQEAHSK
ncbi:MAG TPA: rhodanese-like domain-containing protein [Candidatus Marinimicrobia bacterium]|nr:rhodanese-like domain-containing protein [Candidatus Neomarinimicrobiota bacterium]